MEQVFLKFYVRESDRHDNRQVWEWLLAQANRLNVSGGSAFRAIAGFGRHHTVREERFVELAGTVTIAVEFVLTSNDADELLALIANEKLQLHYVRSGVTLGMTGAQ